MKERSLLMSNRNISWFAKILHLRIVAFPKWLKLKNKHPHTNTLLTQLFSLRKNVISLDVLLVHDVSLFRSPIIPKSQVECIMHVL